MYTEIAERRISPGTRVDLHANYTRPINHYIFFLFLLFFLFFSFCLNIVPTFFYVFKNAAGKTYDLKKARSWTCLTAVCTAKQLNLNNRKRQSILCFSLWEVLQIVNDRTEYFNRIQLQLHWKLNIKKKTVRILILRALTKVNQKSKFNIESRSVQYELRMNSSLNVDLLVYFNKFWYIRMIIGFL